MLTPTEIMSKWPTDADFARDIGIKPTHAQTMKVRGSIPWAYWPEVVAAARRRGIKGITIELLAAAAQAAKAKRRSEPEHAAS